jgi:hypothetical protein
MTPTYYMERQASMPQAAPVGAVDLGSGSRRRCTSPSAQHRAAFSYAVNGNGVKHLMTGIDRKIWLTTTRSARHLGRPST